MIWLYPTVSSYLIDDQGITGTPWALVDLVSADKFTDYCIDTAHKSGSFMGTVAIICATKDIIVCREKPCVSFCCPQGNYFDVGTSSCEIDPGQTLPKLPFKSRDDGSPVDVSPKEIKFFFENSPR